jgi:hypothetical protein
MEFKEAIKAYQERGDKTVILTIIEALDLDFMRDFGRERIMDGSQHGGIRIYSDRPEHYIAYRIKAMESLIVKKLSGELLIPESKEYEFQRILNIIIIDFKIKLRAKYIKSEDRFLDFYEIDDKLMDDIRENLNEILERLEQMYNRSQSRYFQELFEFIDGEQEYIQAMRERVGSNAVESARRALEKALKYVDVDRSEQEIVKYINRTFSTQFADDEIERSGLQRIQRVNSVGKRVNYIVKKEFPKRLISAIFGYDFQNDRHVLTKSENEFIEEAINAIQKDINTGNIQEYTCDINGTAIVNRKHLAKNLNRSHDSVRKKLSRIKKKLNSVTNY